MLLLLLRALLPALLASGAGALPAGWAEHAPHPSAVVDAGDARFTVIHPHVVRMEYSATRAFDDRPTVAFQNRRPFPVPPFTVERPGGGAPGVTITTSALHLVWTGGQFSPTSLSVSLRGYPFSTWVHGSAGAGNLHGTIRTLDRVGEPLDLTCKPPRTAMEFYAHCSEGLVSTDGWVVVDDSLRPRVQLSRSEGGDGGRHVMEGWPWPVSPPPLNVEALQSGQPSPYADLYFFGFGLNHTGAVGVYTAMSGPLPLLPWYALGTGFSRWFAYGQLEEVEGVGGPTGQGGILSSFEAWGVPLDMLSVDMDWQHPAFLAARGLRVHPRTGEAAEGWTGWSWEPHLFPDPKALTRAAARRGVAVNLNQHPADGVGWDEAAYPAAARAVGLDPATLAKIEFDPANQSYVAALLEHVIKPLDDAGPSFWWQDFQHGPFSTVPLLNPTYLTNLYLWENPWRYGAHVHGRRLPHTQPAVSPAQLPYVDRPFLFGRWSGLGGHRMPIGFAGDTAVKWRVLRYEAYYSATASNVGFMWSHDVGGFEGAPEPELMVRWSQWGALSAMLRGHSSKMSPPRTAWTFPHPYFGCIRDAWRLRAALHPYLVAAQRTSHETGLQLLQPMYWHYPAAPGAYTTQGQHQYFLGAGQAVWVAPIASPLLQDGSVAASATLTLQQRVQQDAQRKPGSQAFNVAAAQHHGRVPWTMWVPPGTWVEWGSWQGVRGDSSATRSAAPAGRALPTAYNTGPGSFIARNYTLSEIPIFSPPGALILRRVLPGSASAATGPSHPASTLGIASRPFTDLAVWVMPLAPPDGVGGAGPDGKAQRYGPWPLPQEGWAGASGTLGPTGGSLTSSARLYEDDGKTQAAADGWYADTRVECTWGRGRDGKAPRTGGALSSFSSFFGGGADGGDGGGGGVQDSVACSIRAPEGKGYPGHPDARVVTWRLIGVWPPSSIEVDGTLLTPADRDQAGLPDNSGEHGAWLPGVNTWAYHGPSASLWIHLGAHVATTRRATRVASDGTSSEAGEGGAVHSVRVTFAPGARVDDPLLTAHGTHRLVARSLTCKEEVDRSYGLAFPVDIASVLNVSADSVRLGGAADAGAARALLAALISSAGAGVEEVGRWAIPAGQHTMLYLKHHCLGALHDGLAPPKALPAEDARAAHAARPLAFAADVYASKGSAPGMVSQHEEGGEGGDDEWEGRGWELHEGGRVPKRGP